MVYYDFQENNAKLEKVFSVYIFPFQKRGVGAKWNQNVDGRSVVTTLATFEAIYPLSLCRVDSLQAPIQGKGEGGQDIPQHVHGDNSNNYLE